MSTSVSNRVQHILDKLQCVRSTPKGWDALCPCLDHNQDGDQHASLHLEQGEDGRVLITCRVGCQTDAILDALGLDWADLFATEGDEEHSTENASGVCITFAEEKPHADLVNRAYASLLEHLPLDTDHRQNLHQRGLSDGEIDRRGYRSLRNVNRSSAAKAVHQALGDAVFSVPGFVQGEFGVTLDGQATGLVIPVRDLKGRIVALKIRRATDPKYLYLTGSDGTNSPGSPVHVPLGVNSSASMLRVTEGELKADVCCALDSVPTISVPGVNQWSKSLPVLTELGAKTVVIAYDCPDLMSKPPVLEQAEAFYRELINRNFEVELEVWDELQRN